MAATGVVELLPVDFVRMRARRVVFTEHQLGALSDTTFSPLGNHLTSLILGACAIKSLPARLLVDLTQLIRHDQWRNPEFGAPSTYIQVEHFFSFPTFSPASAPSLLLMTSRRFGGAL